MHQTGILNLTNRLYGGAVTDTNAACRLMAGETANAWMLEGAVPLRFSDENAAERGKFDIMKSTTISKLYAEL